MGKIKYFLLACIFFITFIWIIYANEYIYFYQIWCWHCEKVDLFIEENWWFDKFWITKKEIRFDKNNKIKMDNYVSELWLPVHSVWTPFIVKLSWDQPIDYMVWDIPIIDYFSSKEIISERINYDNNTWMQLDTKKILWYWFLIVVVWIIWFFALSWRSK